MKKVWQEDENKYVFELFSDHQRNKQAILDGCFTDAQDIPDFPFLSYYFYFNPTDILIDEEKWLDAEMNCLTSNRQMNKKEAVDFVYYLAKNLEIKVSKTAISKAFTDN